jgi:hypothetical protein
MVTEMTVERFAVQYSEAAVETVPIFVIAAITQFIRVFKNSGKTTYEVWKCERLIDASRSRDILWPSYT